MVLEKNFEVKGPMVQMLRLGMIGRVLSHSLSAAGV